MENTNLRYQAYDSHCNLVLGDVEETIYVVEDDDDENDELKVRCAPGPRKVVRLPPLPN